MRITLLPIILSILMMGCTGAPEQPPDATERGRPSPAPPPFEAAVLVEEEPKDEKPQLNDFAQIVIRRREGNTFQVGGKNLQAAHVFLVSGTSEIPIRPDFNLPDEIGFQDQAFKDLQPGEYSLIVRTAGGEAGRERAVRVE
jgi:hypothetical protein